MIIRIDAGAAPSDYRTDGESSLVLPPVTIGLMEKS